MTNQIIYAGIAVLALGGFIYMRKRRKRSKLESIKDSVKSNVDQGLHTVGKKVEELRSQAQSA